MAATLDSGAAHRTIKDATVSQGYYSVSRGTLLSRDYADRDCADLSSHTPQPRHSRHRFRRWLSRLYTREYNKGHADEPHASSAIATAGTTAGIDSDLSPASAGSVKRDKLSTALDTCSDTHIDLPSQTSEPFSLRWKATRFHTLRDWFHKTLRRPRNPDHPHYQKSLALADFAFAAPVTPALAALPAPAPESAPESAPAAPAVPADRPARPPPPELALVPALAPALHVPASFNNIGHLGDDAIKDDDEGGDMYIKLKDIGLSPTNEFYRELYAICNI